MRPIVTDGVAWSVYMGRSVGRSVLSVTMVSPAKAAACFGGDVDLGGPLSHEIQIPDVKGQF